MTVIEVYNCGEWQKIATYATAFAVLTMIDYLHRNTNALVRTRRA